MQLSEIKPDITDDKQAKQECTIAVPEPEIQSGTLDADQVDKSILEIYFPQVSKELQMQSEAAPPVADNLRLLLSTEDLAGFETWILNSEQSKNPEEEN